MACLSPERDTLTKDKKKKRGRVPVSLVHTSRLSIGLSTSEICVCLFILFWSRGGAGHHLSAELNRHAAAHVDYRHERSPAARITPRGHGQPRRVVNVQLHNTDPHGDTTAQTLQHVLRSTCYFKFSAMLYIFFPQGFLSCFEVLPTSTEAHVGQT